MIRLSRFVIVLPLVLGATVLPAGKATAPVAWQTVAAQGPVTARHETAFVAHKGKLYLIGGRRINPVEVFDPATGIWTRKGATPIDLHHVQAVSLGDAIYLVGAFTGRYPNETPVDRVIIYHPDEDRFEDGPMIPEARRRGAAGVAVHKGKIYLVGGSTHGHAYGFQPWLDRFDPATGKWTVLADAPRARDHFHAAVVGNKLYALGGRLTEQRTGHVFDQTVAQSDVYDLRTGRWETIRGGDIPTPRAGTMAIAQGRHVVVIGGESGASATAHADVEAFDTRTRRWTAWPSLNRGRHGTGVGAIGSALYVAAGSGNRGGSPELDSVEKLPAR